MSGHGDSAASNRSGVISSRDEPPPPPCFAPALGSHDVASKVSYNALSRLVSDIEFTTYRFLLPRWLVEPQHMDTCLQTTLHLHAAPRAAPAAPRAAPAAPRAAPAAPRAAPLRHVRPLTTPFDGTFAGTA